MRVERPRRVRMLWSRKKGQMAARLAGTTVRERKVRTRIAQGSALRVHRHSTGAARPHHTPSLDRLRRREEAEKK